MQTGTCSLPKIMKGYYINLLNRDFLPEAEGCMLVLWNATLQQQSLTVQTCICINVAGIKCLNRNRESTLQASRKDDDSVIVSPSVLKGFTVTGGIIQPYSMFKNYHTRPWRDYFLQYGIPYPLLPPVYYLLTHSADMSQRISTNLFAGLDLFWEAILLNCNTINTVQSFTAASAFHSWREWIDESISHVTTHKKVVLYSYSVILQITMTFFFWIILHGID